ncbi:uncharacterized protein LOC113745762 [Larimichthys crocea]|uniref:uncharacterized protein LOC113745762 n=1 Tax=Larimichthys crocea TaxID=215358 RepID=UPI000F5F515A|nr:uncharacterized protein LOC113745762 [Larimichthys crocea]XP_027134491.1 uncharacterized protein LOC113745762 [Larimichthys crocea]
MAAPVKLRIILGENNSQRLILPDGIPESVSELSQQIKRQCGIEGLFRLQFMDMEFGNEFTNLLSISDVQDKGTIKVIFISDALVQPGGLAPPPSPVSASSCSPDDSSLSSGCSFDTDILSSPESSSSRSSAWPVLFQVPRFSYDTELQLDRANAAFKATGTLLNPDTKLKSAILNGLAEKIITYKVYLSDSEFENVAEALILKHPCLKEPGSVSGYSGWKTSLKYKLGNYRTKLRELGCPEVTVNALKQKPHGKCSPAYAVKKPKKAEVNYCPAYPTGETTQTLEMIRVALLSEVQKRNNDDKVAMMMDKTFALRREEVVREAPMIADFKTRWPALFHVQEVSSEFKRITTLHLQSKFFSELDAHSAILLKAYSKKGGVQGKKIKSIMVPITQTDSVDVRRECVLKGLCVYLNEDPEKLVKEYMTADESSGSTMAETVFGIFVMRHEGAEPGDAPEDVGIILEGVEVLNNLGSVPFAVAMLLALAYALNLSYPPELKYTFEALQKIIMELDESRLSRKVQALKTYLCR